MQISTALHLQLDHIQDPTLRPLDELFTDHFMQAFISIRTGEWEWTYEEFLAAAPSICQTARSGELGKEKSDSNLHLRIACLIIGSRNKTHRAAYCGCCCCAGN